MDPHDFLQKHVFPILPTNFLLLVILELLSYISNYLLDEYGVSHFLWPIPTSLQIMYQRGV